MVRSRWWPLNFSGFKVYRRNRTRANKGQGMFSCSRRSCGTRLRDYQHLIISIETGGREELTLCTSFFVCECRFKFQLRRSSISVDLHWSWNTQMGSGHFGIHFLFMCMIVFKPLISCTFVVQDWLTALAWEFTTPNSWGNMMREFLRSGHVLTIICLSRQDRETGKPMASVLRTVQWRYGALRFIN